MVKYVWVLASFEQRVAWLRQAGYTYIGARKIAGYSYERLLPIHHNKLGGKAHVQRK